MARGKWEPVNIGILVLDPTSKSSLKIGGGAVARVPNSPVIVDSVNSEAMYASGTGPILQSEHFEITGGYAGGSQGQQFQGPIDTGVPRPRTPTGTWPPRTRRPCPSSRCRRPR